MDARPPRPPLWLALHFPQLPIDRIGPNTHAGDELHDGSDDESDDDEVPHAVIVKHGASRRVLACNAAATYAGVRAGIDLNSAFAMVPNLAVSPFDEVAQLDQLEQLALWALGFSSRVTPKPPDLILLEIGASLRLFGGLKALLVAARESLAAQGVTVSRGIAPTPAAAMLFARIGQPRPVRESSRLRAVLETVPLAGVPLDEFAFKGLAQSGIRDLGGLMALPPKALARRFGTPLSDWLYRLDGRLPDPQPTWHPPEIFSSGLDLPLEAPDAQALAFPLNRLLGALGGFLTAGDHGVRELQLQLFHHRLPPTVVALRFVDASANVKHLRRVAGERLATVRLPAPVIRLVVDAIDLAPVEHGGRDLFDKASPGANGTVSGIEQVLDRLSARLGAASLYTAAPGEDHRPERAWMQALLEVQRPPADWPARPLWLYPEPRLANRRLTLLTSPERIENGWWGDNDVRRDYFIAHDTGGVHYWVFRTRTQPDRLWVHGLFS